MTVSSTEAGPSVGSARSVAVTPKKARPVLWWAFFGAVCGIVSLYALAAWILSGNAKPISAGPTDVPLYMMIPIRAHEAVGLIALIIFAHLFLIRPWLRKRELTWDGMYLIASLMVYPTNDLLLNYTQPTALYSSFQVNFGSWFCHLPGWNSPNGCKQVEPLLFAWTWYSWGFLGVAMLGCWVLRKVKARWPQMGAVGLIGVCFLMSVYADFVLEVFYVITGFYHYGGAAKGWTLWHGHYFQFPIYESIFWGACWTGMICIRFFKDDKGQSVYERGLDRVNVRPRAKPLISMLAILGAMNFLYVALYNLPQNWVGIHSGTWPEDIVKRSYFTTGVCGPQSDYACPGSAVPIPRTDWRTQPDSYHLDRNNNLTFPEDSRAKLPTPGVEWADKDPGLMGDKLPPDDPGQVKK